MSVAANGGNTLDSEVKWLDGKPGLLKEGHDEAAEAAVDMEANVVLLRELAEGNYVILATVREVDGRADDLGSER